MLRISKLSEKIACFFLGENYMQVFEITGHWIDEKKQPQTYLCVSDQRGDVEDVSEQVYDDDIFFYFESGWSDKESLQKEIGNEFNLVSVDKAFFTIKKADGNDIDLSITLENYLFIKELAFLREQFSTESPNTVRAIEIINLIYEKWKNNSLTTHPCGLDEVLQALS